MFQVLESRNIKRKLALLSEEDGIVSANELGQIDLEFSNTRG